MAFKNRIVRYGEELIDNILFNEENFRIHTKEQQEAIEGLVEEEGWVKPILINLRTDESWGADRNITTLVDGEARCKLAARHGETTIPAIYIDVDRDSERKILVGLDTTVSMAGTDREKLAGLISRINTENEKLSAFFDGVKERERLDEFYNAEAVEEDDVPIERADELQEEWQVQVGQVWEIPSASVPNSVHRIACGDSTDASLFARLMLGDKARMVWTDPPYGVKLGIAVDPNNNPMGYHIRSIKNDDLSNPDLTILINNVLKNCSPHTVDVASVYMASPSGDKMPALLDSFTGSGFDWHWVLVWVKDALVLGRGDYNMRHENIIYGWKPKGKHYFTADRTQTSVFEFPRPKVSEEHPTMKPIGLVAQHVRNSSKETEIVLDPFCGSGTTIIACERVRRVGRGIELAPEYVAVTLQRLYDLGLVPRLLVDDVTQTPEQAE